MSAKPLALLAFLALTACFHHHNDLCGTYRGILPAADGPGIETTIRFQTNHAYHQTIVYINQADGRFDESGEYRIEGQLLELTPDDPQDEITWYRLEDKQIRRLDMEKQPITGALSDHYVLKQVQSCPQQS